MPTVDELEDRNGFPVPGMTIRRESDTAGSGYTRTIVETPTAGKLQFDENEPVDVELYADVEHVDSKAVQRGGYYGNRGSKQKTEVVFDDMAQCRIEDRNTSGRKLICEDL